MTMKRDMPITDHSNRNYDVLIDLVETHQLAADETAHVFRFTDPTEPIKLKGSGNYRPRQEFADELFKLSDEEYVTVCERYIWLAAYAANNPVSDYHWMCDACYQEAQRRGKPELYEKAWHEASGM